jgi:hypothetical protein
MFLRFVRQELPPFLVTAQTLFDFLARFHAMRRSASCSPRNAVAPVWIRSRKIVVTAGAPAAEQPLAARVVILWRRVLREDFRMPRVENNRVVESATEARAAVTGHNVRYVLVVGTLAVIVLFAVVYLATRW